MKLSDPKFEEKWMREFTARLRHRMEYLGITEYELAKRAGLTAAAIYRWRTYKNGPTAMNIVKIAKVLAVKPEYLIDFPELNYRDSNEQTEDKS